MTTTETRDGASLDAWASDTAHDPGTVRPRTTIITADDLTRTIASRWRTIAVTVIVVAGMAAALAALQPKQYRASSVAAVVAVAGNIPPDELYRGLEVLEQRTIVSTVAALASLPATEQQALGSHAGKGRYAIQATVLPNTNLLRVDVDGPDPVIAAEIANRVPAVLATQTRLMYVLYGVKTMSEATPPRAASLPRLARTVAAGAVLGLILGIGGVIGAESLKRKAAR